MSNEMMGRCGLSCSECPAFIATRTNDAALQKRTAEKWSIEYHSDIRPEQVVCDGCNSKGRHFHYCSICELRSCAGERNLENCGLCPEYACDKLATFFVMVPPAQEQLDAYRKTIGR